MFHPKVVIIPPLISPNSIIRLLTLLLIFDLIFFPMKFVVLVAIFDLEKGGAKLSHMCIVLSEYLCI